MNPTTTNKRNNKNGNYISHFTRNGCCFDAISGKRTNAGVALDISYGSAPLMYPGTGSRAIVTRSTSQPPHSPICAKPLSQEQDTF